MNGRVVRLEVAPGGEVAAAVEVRALSPQPPAIDDDVRTILASVRDRGDAAVLEYTARFDGAEVAPERLRVAPEEIEAARAGLAPELADALRAAIANVEEVAFASLREGSTVTLAAGQRVELLELPVARAAAYVPGGRAPYPSTVVMCATTAHVAGVADLAVCAPPGPDGEVHPTILAACSLCGVEEVYRMGGAQAIAALAYGTASVPAVDVIVGPGSAWVQEAKRQVVGRVGIDGVAGPSEIVVAASAGADPALVTLDLLAQAEHGPASLLALVSDDDGLLEAVGNGVAAGAGEAEGPPLALVRMPDPASAVHLADLIAPEHVQLMGDAVEAHAGAVRRAGALYVGRDAATAFGDYIAGSNHVLPTGGAARHASALSVATFRRRMARVTLDAGAAGALAGEGATIARAEGFVRHAESMERRAV